MNYGPALLLVGAVATVGVLHTIVPDHWGADHADCTATGLVEIRNRQGRASGRDRARPLDTAHRDSRLARRSRLRRTLRPHRRYGLEPRTHCLWRLVCRLRMARSAEARWARAQS